MSRPSFHDIYMNLAVSLAERSTCDRKVKVGAVISSVDFRKILAVGYNGNASGLRNGCDITGPEAVGKCGCLHAEENAVINCDVSRGTEKIVFCTHLPCSMCAKRLINVGGVKEVYYLNDYRLKDSLEMFDTVSIRTGHHVIGEGPGAAQHRAYLALQAYKIEKTLPVSPKTRD
jgi:dCMP deaminase